MAGRQIREHVGEPGSHDRRDVDSAAERVTDDGCDGASRFVVVLSSTPTEISTAERPVVTSGPEPVSCTSVQVA
jgi:hypothetical protein